MLFILVLSAFTISSCKKTEFKLRVKNSLNEKIDYIDIGNISLGSIYPGANTSYKSIPEGTHDVDGETESSVTIYGSVSLTSKSDYAGEHQFTVTVFSSGVSLSED